MPDLVIYTNPLTPGIAQLPVFSVGDSQNWSLLFNDGTNFYNPTNVTMAIGYVKGLPNVTLGSAFQWVDRMNNQHTASLVVAAGLPGALTWDENPIGVFGDNGAWLLRGRTPPSGTIRKVYVKFGGTGVSTAPAIRFQGGTRSQTGQRATATATIGGAAITALVPVTYGRGYSATNPPEVIITGDGSGAVVVVSAVSARGEITAYAVVTGGSGYTTATVTVVDPEATATATVGGTSAVTGLRVSNQGTGYTSAPAVAITGGGGASATAMAALLNSTWGLSGLTLTGAGSGYTTPPTISFSGGTGSGAAAVATINYSDQVEVCNVTAGGNYVQNDFPLVVFSGGGSPTRQAQAIPIMSNPAGGDQVIGILITDPGAGYSSAPAIAFVATSSFSVNTAAATAVLGTGKITSLTLTNPGTGYGATAPTVAFSSGAATATAQLAGSPISPVLTITAGGSGYTSVPLVGFSGGAGTGAAATALLTLGITAITMVQGGFDYSSLPSLYCVPDAGALLIPAGVESHSVPFLQNITPASAVSAITVTPYTNGRRDSTGDLIYDDSLLIVRPRYIIQPTLTLQPDGLTWAAVFTPVTTYVNALLAFRRSVVAEIEIFGGGRLLYTGLLTIQAA